MIVKGKIHMDVDSEGKDTSSLQKYFVLPVLLKKKVGANIRKLKNFTLGM